MSRKLFYFVRHGESEMNAAHLRQGREGKLSEKGREQARATGVRLGNTHFDVMLVSPYERTIETAAIILESVKITKEPEYLELLIERRNPTEIVGKSGDSMEVARIIDIIDKSYHDDNFRYSDEENFADLKARAKKLLEYLETRQEKTILVVTHSIFLKMVAAYMIHRDALDAKKYNLLSFTNSSNNASITVAECRNGFFRDDSFLGRLLNIPKEKRWRLLAWDDYTR